MYSTAIRRHAYIPSDNLPNNRTLHYHCKKYNTNEIKC